MSYKLSMSISPQSEDEISYISRVPYVNAIGYLMYAMVCTRLNIDCLMHYMAQPGKEH